MTDYLKPISRFWRRFSIVGCALTFALCLLLASFICYILLRRHSAPNDGHPLWLAVVFIAALGFAAAFIAWRLLKGERAANGVTMLPARFIQGFALFMLVTHVVIAYYHGEWWFLWEGTAVFLTMVLAGRRLAKPGHDEVAGAERAPDERR